MSLLDMYSKAREIESSDRNSSCGLFAKLSTAQFELKNLSLMRAHLVCDTQQRKSLAPITDSLLKNEPWLNKIDIERQRLIAEESKDDSLMAQVYYQMARSSDRTKDKLELLQKALKSNSQIPDPKIEDIERIKNIKERIYKLAPRLNPKPKPEDYFIVGQDFIYQRQFEKGRQYLEKFFNNSNNDSNDRYLARKAYRNSYKTEQRKKDHIEQAKIFAEWAAKNTQGPKIQEAYVTWARAVWTQGNPTECLRILHEAEKLLHSQPAAMAEIEFIRARVSEEAKDYKKALAELDKSLSYSQQNGKSNLAYRTLFQKSWLLKKQNLHAEAAKSFARLSEIADDPSEKNKSLFWQAKSLKQSQKNDEALILFKKLQVEDPLGYYGLVSFYETEEELPALNSISSQNTSEDPAIKTISGNSQGPSSKTNSRRPASKASTPFLTSEKNQDSKKESIAKVNSEGQSPANEEQKEITKNTSGNENSELIPGEKTTAIDPLIQALIKVQELEVLKSLLENLTEKPKDISKFSEKDWLYLLKVYAKAGLYQPLFQKITQLPPATKSKLLNQHPDLLFPMKFMEPIRKASKKFNVSTELILSIIRQESSFDPNARSIADALGLMQVIPQVADQQAGKTGIKVSHHEDLYKPEINVPVGASLLADLQKKYQDQFILVAAAYNANEKSIQTWLETRLGEDPLEFIEDIPFEETRGYVKLVLRNFIFYSRLNQPNQSMKFPRNCLETLSRFKLSKN